MEHNPFGIEQNDPLANYEAEIDAAQYLKATDKHLLKSLVAENKTGTVDIVADNINDSWTVLLSEAFTAQQKAEGLAMALADARNYCDEKQLEPDALSVTYTPLH
jgi:hypothetical protein